jgi:hypothetical protein
MAFQYTVQRAEDFEQIMVEKDFEISKLIVEKALANLFSKKRYIHIFDVEVIEDDSIIEITLDRKDMLDVLEKNLTIYEHYEAYEDCVLIQEAINKLKSK